MTRVTRGSAMNEVWRRFSPALIFLALVLPATVILNFTFANFHAPDDYDHVKRAYTLIHHPLRMRRRRRGIPPAL